MTFLQPFILWGLPLILVPVIIHLINRMRHRPQPWAAMMFLVAATRASTNRAKLKQWLVLAFRVLAVTALLLFLARPLGGGWLGWAVNAAPDVIVVVLDRSASMETRLPGQNISRREHALNIIKETADKFAETSHLVLLDSATRQAQQIADASALLEETLTGPTDTAADLPGLLQTAHRWLVENQAGASEIWIASDLQVSNWHPEDDRWEILTAQFEEMLRPVSFRLLTFDVQSDLNRAVSLAELNRPAETPAQLQLDLNLAATKASKTAFPLKLKIGDAELQADITVNASSLRWQKQLDIAENQETPWGHATLPADANSRDNEVFFIAQAEATGRTLVVSDAPEQTLFMRIAAMAPNATGPAEVMARGAFEEASLNDVALVVWHSKAPAKDSRLARFISDGGVALFIPTDQNESDSFGSTQWNAADDANVESTRVVEWDENDGPLADTEEGLSLALDQVRMLKHMDIESTDTVLARMRDGSPFLTRGNLGRGNYFHLATQPHTSWSNLERGDVLVPMLQRLLQLGNRRFGQDTMIACGELSVADRALPWHPVGSDSTKNIRIHAGLYRSGERIVAVNRPSTEDDSNTLTNESVEQLFGELPLRMAQQADVESNALQGEIWRMFLFGMLSFLIVESWLVLPTSAESLRRTNPLAP